jgi:uncharacterized DUF497 family protein
MSIPYECKWDPKKAVANLRKHGVSFVEASSVLDDVLSVTVIDRDHSESEARYLTIGMARSGRLLVVGHTERSGNVRIFSARLASKSERRLYESG